MNLVVEQDRMNDQEAATSTKCIAVTGASGLVGSRLREEIDTRGDRILQLVRRKPTSYEQQVQWDPAAGTISAERLEGVDAVVHLAGENIAGGRWTDDLKRRIRDSRVKGTTFLSETLAGLEKRPEVLVCASAIGFYGDRGTRELDETAESGTGFLPDVCREWEAACEPARQAGIRVVNLRIGVVMAKEGGALEKMLLPFKMGVGGVVGSGQQYWSWVGIEDVVGSILHAIDTKSLVGPVNAVAPDAVTNREFTKTLGRVLSRPTVLPLPAFAAKIVLGQMANDLLLASTRVVPKRLEESGYAFRQPNLETALRGILDRPA